MRKKGRGLARGLDDLGKVVKPFPLKGNPPSGNEGDGGKPQGEGVLSLIPKGEVEEHRIRTIVVVTGKEDRLDFGEGNPQVDPLTIPSPGHLKEQNVTLNP